MIFEDPEYVKSGSLKPRIFLVPAVWTAAVQEGSDPLGRPHSIGTLELMALVSSLLDIRNTEEWIQLTIQNKSPDLEMGIPSHNPN